MNQTPRKTTNARRRKSNDQKSVVDTKTEWIHKPLNLPYKGNHLTDEKIAEVIERLIV